MSDKQIIINPEQSYIKTSLSVVEANEDTNIGHLTIITNEEPKNTLGTNNWIKLLDINDLSTYYLENTRTYKMIQNTYNQTNCNGFNFSFTRLNGYINLIYTKNFTDATRTKLVSKDLKNNLDNFSDKEGYLSMVYQQNSTAIEEIEERYVVFPKFASTLTDEEKLEIIVSQLNKAQFSCNFEMLIENNEDDDTEQTYKIVIYSRIFGDYPLSAKATTISTEQQSYNRVDFYGTSYLDLSGQVAIKGTNASGEKFTDIISRLNGIQCHFIAPVMNIDVEKLKEICVEMDNYYSQKGLRYGLVYTCPSSYELEWLNKDYYNTNYQNVIQTPCYYGISLEEQRGALLSYLGSYNIKVEKFPALELKCLTNSDATEEQGMSLQDFNRVKQTRYYGYFYEGNNSYRTQGSINALQIEHISIIMQDLMAFTDFIKDYTKNTYKIGKTEEDREEFLDYMYSRSNVLYNNDAIQSVPDSLMSSATEEARESIKSRGIHFELSAINKVGAELEVKVAFGLNNNYVSFKVPATLYANK